MITALLTATVLAAPQHISSASFVDPLALSPGELADLPPARRARDLGEPFDADGIPLSAYRTAEIVVRARPGMELDLAAWHQSIGAMVAERIERGGFERVVLPPSLDVRSAVRLYRKQPFVGSAEHNFICRPSHVPNDPEFNRGGAFDQWGPKRMNLQRVWDATFGDSGVIIAVVDMGIDNTHFDLAASLVTGRNTYSNNSDTWNDGSASGTFEENHGTIGALIAVANNNNVNGITGIAPGCRVMPIKVCRPDETIDIFDSSEGVEWAADHGAQVINMSFGNYYGALVQEWAVSHAAEAGCILVASAGNDGVTTKVYPAAYPNVIAVAATDFKTDARLSWSNYGSWVDVAAPGMALPVVLTGGTDPFYMMGTSFASPSVAGVAALLYPLFDHLGTIGARDAVIGRIRDYCDSVPGAYVARGRVNAYDAMNYGNYDNHSSFAPAYIDIATYTLVSGSVESLELGQGNNQRLVAESWAFDQPFPFPPTYSEKLAMPCGVKVSYPGTLKAFDVLLEGHSSSALSLQVSAYNFVTTTWSLLGTFSMTTTDSTATFTFSSASAPNYVNFAGEMRLKYECTQSANFNFPHFQVRMDQVRVTTRSR